MLTRIGWSGLRGAVSLAMAMIVEIEPGIKKQTGSQVMFHVGGVAALTLFTFAHPRGIAAGAPRGLPQCPLLKMLRCQTKIGPK